MTNAVNIALTPAGVPVADGIVCLEPDEVHRALGSSPAGLTTEEADQRLRRGGPNELPRPRPPHPLRVLLQILWVNLLTDSFPALALGLEPGEPGIMERPPRPRTAGILSLASVLPIIGIGSLVAVPALAGYAWGRSTGDVELVRQLAFATLISAHLVATFNFRSATRSVFQLEQNRWMLAAIALSGALLIAVIYVPWLQEPFRTGPFTWQQWLGIGGLSLVPLVIVEAAKLVRNAGGVDAHRSPRTDGRHQAS